MNCSAALDHCSLDFNSAVPRIDDAAELDNRAVASALDDAAMMHGDGWVDQIAPKGPKPCEDPIFVRASKPGVADDVGHQDRRKLAGLAHGTSAAAKFPVAVRLGMAALPGCAQEDVEAGSAALRVDRSVYPRRLKT